MNMTIRDIEQAALDAHRRRDTWATFWPTVAGDVAAVANRSATPWGRDNAAYRKLVARLSHLLTAGDTDGMVPAGATEPHEAHDQAVYPVVSDSETAARCLWSPGTEARA